MTAPLRGRRAELQLALMLLTRLPAGRLASPAPALGRAAWAYPVAGLAVGAVAATGLVAAGAAGLPAGIAAGLAIALGMLATGALHEDGLADVADGFGGGRDAAHRLDIMRDSRIGSYGTLALIVAVGLRWQAITALAAIDLWAAAGALVALAAASRAGLPAVLATVPPARADGMGRLAAAVAPGQAAVAGGIGLVAVALAAGPALAIAGALAVAAVTVLCARIARRAIGGQTGDVLGAMQVLAELTLWIVLLVGLT